MLSSSSSSSSLSTFSSIQLRHYYKVANDEIKNKNGESFGDYGNEEAMKRNKKSVVSSRMDSKFDNRIDGERLRPLSYSSSSLSSPLIVTPMKTSKPSLASSTSPIPTPTLPSLLFLSMNQSFLSSLFVIYYRRREKTNPFFSLDKFEDCFKRKNVPNSIWLQIIALFYIILFSLTIVFGYFTTNFLIANATTVFDHYTEPTGSNASDFFLRNFQNSSVEFDQFNHHNQDGLRVLRQQAWNPIISSISKLMSLPKHMKLSSISSLASKLLLQSKIRNRRDLRRRKFSSLFMSPMKRFDSSKSIRSSSSSSLSSVTNQTNLERENRSRFSSMLRNRFHTFVASLNDHLKSRDGLSIFNQKRRQAEMEKNFAQKTNSSSIDRRNDHNPNDANERPIEERLDRELPDSNHHPSIPYQSPTLNVIDDGLNSTKIAHNVLLIHNKKNAPYLDQNQSSTPSSTGTSKASPMTTPLFEVLKNHHYHYYDTMPSMKLHGSSMHQDRSQHLHHHEILSDDLEFVSIKNNHRPSTFLSFAQWKQKNKIGNNNGGGGGSNKPSSSTLPDQLGPKTTATISLKSTTATIQTSTPLPTTKANHPIMILTVDNVPSNSMEIVSQDEYIDGRPDDNDDLDDRYDSSKYSLYSSSPTLIHQASSSSIITGINNGNINNNNNNINILSTVPTTTAATPIKSTMKNVHQTTKTMSTDTTIDYIPKWHHSVQSSQMNSFHSTASHIPSKVTVENKINNGNSDDHERQQHHSLLSTMSAVTTAASTVAPLASFSSTTSLLFNDNNHLGGEHITTKDHLISINSNELLNEYGQSSSSLSSSTTLALKNEMKATGPNNKEQVDFNINGGSTDQYNEEMAWSDLITSKPIDVDDQATTLTSDYNNYEDRYWSTQSLANTVGQFLKESSDEENNSAGNHREDESALNTREQFFVTSTQSPFHLIKDDANDGNDGDDNLNSNKSNNVLYHNEKDYPKEEEVFASKVIPYDNESIIVFKNNHIRPKQPIVNPQSSSHYHHHHHHHLNGHSGPNYSSKIRYTVRPPYATVFNYPTTKPTIVPTRKTSISIANVIGLRVKQPEEIRSATLTVLDPPYVPNSLMQLPINTTILHKNILVPMKEGRPKPKYPTRPTTMFPVYPVVAGVSNWQSQTTGWVMPAMTTSPPETLLGLSSANINTSLPSNEHFDSINSAALVTKNTTSLPVTLITKKIFKHPFNSSSLSEAASSFTTSYHINKPRLPPSPTTTKSTPINLASFVTSTTPIPATSSTTSTTTSTISPFAIHSYHSPKTTSSTTTTTTTTTTRRPSIFHAINAPPMPIFRPSDSFVPENQIWNRWMSRLRKLWTTIQPNANGSVSLLTLLRSVIYSVMVVLLPPLALMTFFTA